MDAITPVAPAHPYEGLDRLVRRCAGMAPLVTAIVHPCDETSVNALADAAQAGLIQPVLVGPPAKIREAAAAAGRDISAFRLAPALHSHDAKTLLVQDRIAVSAGSCG